MRLRKKRCYLRDEGILQTQPAADGSAWQEYVLTEKGRALQIALFALAQWGNEWLFAEGEPTSVLVDNLSRRPLQKLALVGLDHGELITLPPVEDLQLWKNLEEARMVLFNAARNAKPASRYTGV